MNTGNKISAWTLCLKESIKSFMKEGVPLHLQIPVARYYWAEVVLINPDLKVQWENYASGEGVCPPLPNGEELEQMMEFFNE